MYLKLYMYLNLDLYLYLDLYLNLELYQYLDLYLNLYLYLYLYLLVLSAFANLSIARVCGPSTPRSTPAPRRISSVFFTESSWLVCSSRSSSPAWRLRRH